MAAPPHLSSIRRAQWVRGDFRAVRTLRLQILCNVRMFAAQGLRQRGAAVVGAGIQLSAVSEQEIDEVAPAEPGGFLKRRESQRLPDVCIRAALEKELRCVELACQEGGL